MSTTTSQLCDGLETLRGSAHTQSFRATKAMDKHESLRPTMLKSKYQLRNENINKAVKGKKPNFDSQPLRKNGGLDQFTNENLMSVDQTQGTNAGDRNPVIIHEPGVAHEKASEVTQKTGKVRQQSFLGLYKIDLF